MGEADVIGLGMYRTGMAAAPALIIGTRIFDLRKAAEILASRTSRDDLLGLAQVTDLVSIFEQNAETEIFHEIADRIDSLPEDLEIRRTGSAGVLACPIRPRQVYCVGMNIAQLFVPGKISGKMPLIREAPYAAPMWWMKASSAVVGPDEDIVHPGEWHTKRLIPEPELGLIIGRPMGPGIASPKASQALDYLAGYCVFNDVSALDIEFERGGDPFAFNMAWSKSYPSFAPLGPVVTLRSGIDPINLAVTMHINAVQKVKENTGIYLWSPQELIEHFAAVTNLMPGDIIACGNLTGEHRVNPGDLVEIEIEKLGLLANRVTPTAREVRYAVPEKVTDYARRFSQTVSSIEKAAG